MGSAAKSQRVNSLYRDPQIQTPALECVVSSLVFVYFYSICTCRSVVLGRLSFLLWVSLRGARLKHFENASLNIPRDRVQEGHASQITALFLPSNDPSRSIQKTPDNKTAVLRNEIRDSPVFCELARDTVPSSPGLSAQPHPTSTPPEGLGRTSSSQTWQSGSRSDVHPGGTSFYWLQRIQNGARRFIWIHEECL